MNDNDYRDDTPSPAIAIAGVSAFLAIAWGGFGYIIGAFFGFPS